MAITSLAFMLVWVPEPVWKTTSGNSASCTPGGNLAGGRDDQAGAVLIELAEVVVGERRALLHQAEGPDDGTRPPEPIDADGEEPERALGLRAPQTIRGDRHVTQGIVLDPHIGGHGEADLVRSAGFEPATPRFEAWCSIQLSYERTAAKVCWLCTGSASGLRLPWAVRSCPPGCGFL